MNESRSCGSSRAWTGALLAVLAVVLLPGLSFAQSPLGIQSEVRVNGRVGTSAQGNGANARTSIGSSANGGGSSSTFIGGDVYTGATRGQSSSTEIGGQGHSGTTSIGGGVVNLNGRVRALGEAHIGGRIITRDQGSADIGGCGSSYVSGDVLVSGGSLELGCACAGRRNGMCCIEFHNGFCVINMVPPSKDGCPPGYYFSEGMCRLYSDFEHRLDR